MVPGAREREVERDDQIYRRHQTGKIMLTHARLSLTMYYAQNLTRTTAGFIVLLYVYCMSVT